MIGIAMYTTVITLHKQGVSKRQISRLTKLDRKTVRRIIGKYDQDNVEAPSHYLRASKVHEWHSKIAGYLEHNLSYVRILEELRASGFNLSYSSLTRYINLHHIKAETCLRFHTLPGEEGQVDFGDVGKRIDRDGKLRKAYVFNMRLSYSRLDYYEVVFDQKISTWIKCHINAFEFFGGVPEYIKLDNLKAGILKAEFYESIYQQDYKRFADHYNFHISPCRVREPQEKGKVESGIKYVKNNFFAGRDFSTYEDMASKLLTWIGLANKRIHGTTKKIPQELFEQEELAKLGSLPLTEFDMATWHYRKVAKDCHITIDNNYYSVPSKYVGEEVGILMSSSLLRIYVKDEYVATHARSKAKGIFTTITSHYAKDKMNCPGFKDYDQKLETQLASIGTRAIAMLYLLKTEHKRDWSKAARGIISLKKIYSDEEIDKACERALHYGITSYSKIKNILESNSQNLPLPDKSEHKEYIEYRVDIPEDIPKYIPGDGVNIDRGREVNYARTA